MAATMPPEEEVTRRKREERDVIVARTLLEVRSQVEVLKQVTSALAEALDGLTEGDE